MELRRFLSSPPFFRIGVLPLALKHALSFAEWGRMGPAVTDAIPSLLCIDVVSKRINRLLQFSDPISVRRRHDDHKQFREDLSSYVGNAAKAIAPYTAIQAIVEWLLPVIIFVL